MAAIEYSAPKALVTALAAVALWTMNLTSANEKNPTTSPSDQAKSLTNGPDANPITMGITFIQWRDDFRDKSLAAGVSPSAFDEAFQNVEPKMTLPDLRYPEQKEDIGQAEFLKSPQSYLNENSLSYLVSEGKKVLKEYSETLMNIELTYGVDRYTVVALWGRETAYSKYKVKEHAITALATQAYAGRRFKFFENELLIALQLLSDGYIKLEEMDSSWAGAMGPTQFIPSDYHKYAVDGDADGKINPWTSIPDALASAASQLATNGWQPGKPWGQEVSISEDLDCSIAVPENIEAFDHWRNLGVSPITSSKDGVEQPLDDSALLLPAGRKGPAFLTTANYRTLIQYNRSELYAIFVGHLSDRLAGAKGFEKLWEPVEPLPESEVTKLQQILQKEGYYQAKIDGKAGSRTRAATGKLQKRLGLVQDCWPSADLISTSD